jgi:D-alanyl-D-alanine carboxypeptidase/D-alanyl-D-alanine-endopeptidase (penicillin-binding protein 4)
MPLRFRDLWIGLCSLLLVVALAAPPADFSAQLDRMLSAQELAGAHVGAFIQSVDSGRIWYARHDGDLFVPASVAKLMTAAIALDYLKPEYAFTTRLLTDGAVADGVLDGNLILQGGGDPLLMPADLDALVNKLSGITAIRGRVLADSSFFRAAAALRGPGWEKADLPWYYAAPPSPLCLAHNAVKVMVSGVDAGQPPQVTLDPPTQLFTIENRGSVVAQGENTLQVQPCGRRLLVTGTLPVGGTLSERVSVPDPAAFLTEQLTAALARRGITVQGHRHFGAPWRQRTVLATQDKYRALNSVATMLTNSDNHVAEQLRLVLLKLYSQETPLEPRYTAMVDDFCAHSGMSPGEFHLVDGSGLSRLNRMTPRGAVRLLVQAMLSDQFDVFYQALPVAGRSGTLQKRMIGTPADGVLHAKTGTMTGVSTLAGYVTTADGQRLVFAVFMENYAGSAAGARKVQDAVAVYLASVKE